VLGVTEGACAGGDGGGEVARATLKLPGNTPSLLQKHGSKCPGLVRGAQPVDVLAWREDGCMRGESTIIAPPPARPCVRTARETLQPCKQVRRFAGSSSSSAMYHLARVGMLDWPVQVSAGLQHAHHTVVEVMHGESEEGRVSGGAGGFVLGLNKNKRACSCLQHGLVRGSADDGKLEGGLEEGQRFGNVSEHHHDAAQRRHANDISQKKETQKDKIS
jgi:hypothetical protein